MGQWLAWGELNNRGFYVSTNPSSSFAFLLTIVHAVHLAGGMIALIFAASASLLQKPPGVASHRSRHHRVVLALHGGAVGLCFWTAGACALVQGLRDKTLNH